jgi:hypothetical protein
MAWNGRKIALVIIFGMLMAMLLCLLVVVVVVRVLKLQLYHSIFIIITHP